VRRRELIPFPTSFALLLLACASPKEPPAPPPTVADARGPGVESNTYLSTVEDGEPEAPEAKFDDGFASDFDCDCVVTSPEQAHEIAGSAVADRLNPKQTWKHSPVMPTTWPTVDRRVRIFFYPMIQNPAALDSPIMLTAAYHVDVSLEDGSTEVTELAKPRKLGEVVDRRASMLERNELALAERALVHTVLGGDATTGENSFWGYRKFFREHPKMARDLQAKSPQFVRWVEQYKK
jgi:hypothetical protein